MAGFGWFIRHLRLTFDPRDFSFTGSMPFNYRIYDNDGDGVLEGRKEPYPLDEPFHPYEIEPCFLVAACLACRHGFGVDGCATTGEFMARRVHNQKHLIGGAEDVDVLY